MGRYQLGRVAIGGVTIYTVLVGAEASVVRAAVMAALFIYATPFLGAFIGQAYFRCRWVINGKTRAGMAGAPGCQAACTGHDCSKHYSI